MKPDERTWISGWSRSVKVLISEFQLEQSFDLTYPVWQIAQRDYKFGKGKFRSLTKPTYDAIGDHFRSLWGKEAGWAHSVLFTADLRAFSERLLSKIEVEESHVKSEESDSPIVSSTKVAVTTAERMKREFEGEEKSSLKVEEHSTTKRSKRRRKT